MDDITTRTARLLSAPDLSDEERAEVAQFLLETLPDEHPWEQLTVNMANSSVASLDLPIRGASSASSGAGSYTGTNGASNNPTYASPLPAGHQQDLNYLYEQIQELSNLLRANRARTAELTRRAEQAEVSTQYSATQQLLTHVPQAQASNGHQTEDREGGVQSDQARIRELERKLAKKDMVIDAYKHEQQENTNLIAMYEDAMGNTTEMIRNYCNGIETRFLEQRRHYNNLLQQEKDEHLASRLEKDDIFAKYLRVREMIRTANRLRTDEWCEEYTIISGLQGQVRCLRRVLQMDPEKPEEEVGWPYLKDLPLNDTDS
ncbi:uncharacterized protein HMPREF1541_02638 [Cyphellophora europaea CBS 101466]|uniref:Uncharacterized protein n=1 Tax=Cyphellophora europaea (strain CBS 101466) TaxID=1220924 RepID=W2S6D0_CYPE1|nr:uncharacterized protein HMPREF1541_02638 [Cyphellophora europaea CBS 101466]ETN43479.1 hypothetical protein HMPREF1541_02638 [Cyphellophora europaea CBS 101466]